MAAEPKAPGAMASEEQADAEPSETHELTEQPTTSTTAACDVPISATRDDEPVKRQSSETRHTGEILFELSPTPASPPSAEVRLTVNADRNLPSGRC